jgi:hypothetical protein
VASFYDRTIPEKHAGSIGEQREKIFTGLRANPRGDDFGPFSGTGSCEEIA